MATRLKPILDFLGIYRPLRYAYKRMRSELDKFMTSASALRARRLVPEIAFSEKLREAVAALTQDNRTEPFGDYLEFGVYNGTSLSCMYSVAEEIGLEQMSFYGFDSFEGLPKRANQDDEGLWVEGQYNCGIDVTQALLTERGIDWERVHLIKGWFSETLTDEMIDRNGIVKAAIVMVDCDNYASAAEALSFVEPLIRGQAVIIFDDWRAWDLDTKNMGEKRAFSEFLEAHPDLIARDLGSYSHDSQVFHVKRSQQGSPH